MKDSNLELAADNFGLKALLDQVTLSFELETEWLDFLAQLEYVGCRKILKSVPFAKVDADLLQHVQEEATHALLLKRNAERRGLKRGWDASQLGRWGFSYFQSVDQAVSALGAASDYSLVSFAVEERVLEIYPIYVERTRDPLIKKSLEQILAQERHHAERFRHDSPELKAQAVAIETKAWGSLMEKLTQWAAV